MEMVEDGWLVPERNLDEMDRLKESNEFTCLIDGGWYWHVIQVSKSKNEFVT